MTTGARRGTSWAGIPAAKPRNEPQLRTARRGREARNKAGLGFSRAHTWSWSSHGQVAVPAAILPCQLPRLPPQDGRRLAVLVLVRLPLALVVPGVLVGHLAPLDSSHRRRRRGGLRSVELEHLRLLCVYQAGEGEGIGWGEALRRRRRWETRLYRRPELVLPFAARRLAPRAGEIDFGRDRSLLGCRCSTDGSQGSLLSNFYSNRPETCTLCNFY